MKPLTIPQFAEKYGLTLAQVQMAVYRDSFDSIISKDVPKKRGGAKHIRLVQETVKTLDQVAKLKKYYKPGNRTVRSSFKRYEQMFYSYNA